MPKRGVLYLMKELVLIAGLSYAGLCILLTFLQSRYVYYPQEELQSTPAELGMRYEELVLETETAGPLHAWWITGQSNEAPAVIICHGNGGNISHRIYLANVFNKWGWHVLLFDYRGYGKSKGKPSEEGTYEDARTARQWLKDSRPEIEKHIIYGRSLGGAVAAQLAVEEPPDVLIIESTFISATAMAKRLFPYLPVRLLCRYRYNTLQSLEKVRCPVAVAHSPDDETIPFEHGRRLYDAVSQPKMFYSLQGGHNDGGLETNPVYQQQLKAFVENAINPG